MIARDIGMTHSNRRDFLIQLGELLCTAERHKQASASQPLQLAQQASTSRGIAAAFCRYFQKNKTRSQCSSVCTTYLCCVGHVPNCCANLFFHCKAKIWCLGCNRALKFCFVIIRAANSIEFYASSSSTYFSKSEFKF